MSKRSRSPEAEVGMNLNLNRSPALSSSESESESVSSASSAILGRSSLSLSSSSSSNMSCEGEERGQVRHSSDEIVTRSMALVGCPGCFMYVMLTENSSQCPKCKNNVFLDFFKHQHQHGYKN